MGSLRTSRDYGTARDVPNFSVRRASMIRSPTSSSGNNSTSTLVNPHSPIDASDIQPISEESGEMPITIDLASHRQPTFIRDEISRSPGVSELPGDDVRTRSSSHIIGFAATTEDDNATITSTEGTSEPTLNIAQMDLETPERERPSVLYPGSDLKRGLAPSMTSMSEATSLSTPPHQQVSTGSRMPEFFGQTVFQTVLHNPTIAHQLLRFAQSRLCGENLEFLDRVTKYQSLLADVSKAVYEIHKDFIASSAPTQINVAESVLLQVNKEMKSALTSTIPAMEAIFSTAQTDIERLVYTDIYPNFVRYQMSVSAAKALGGDRGKYAGLGDCFVLTDPSRADNPIMFASDGFVKVTGYQRNEIIPRNCRFLQGRHTERAAVKRLKDSIDKRHESVELLLNHKKNGEPF
ncbi:hypothetical protein LTR78_008755 [Recurvomyces mirabilis]|uniref:RGS domain-containing protein n=1 Tax=Recurvomyces mirabilis TaxID=574656 RepID=A0AAE0TSP2_9PEZI|nr:hypothetical protein LTR78_008755 [Recurvomyces mirabilis]KAK5161007.1 hypothetical protein LTS14_000801 [Recurvomyces mirabilis]